jgi:hypothetical protein
MDVPKNGPRFGLAECLVDVAFLPCIAMKQCVYRVIDHFVALRFP